MTGTAKKTALIAAVAVLLAGCGGKEDEVKIAVSSLSAAIGEGNKSAVAGLVSKKFSDAGLGYAGVVDEFSIKRPGYMATIDAVEVEDGTAEVSYTRKEVVDKKSSQSKILKEKWTKDEDGKWRLYRFSAFDRNDVPKRMKDRQDAEAKEKADKERLEAEKRAALALEYSYAGKRDPFESLIIEGMVEEGGGEEAVQCDPGRKKEYLEGFDLSAFKLSGVVYSNGFYALLEGQNGHGSTIRIGMHIGKRCGRVVKITPEKVVLEEKHLTPRGDFETRAVELKLREKVE